METTLSIIALIITLVFVVAMIVGVWKVFVKSGERGWKAIIPIYNTYIMLRISGHSGWWLLALLLPLFVIVVAIPVVGFQIMQVADTSQLPGSMSLFVNLFFTAIQISLIISSVMLYDIARSFGKGLGFTLGLGVIPFVFWPILGFDDSDYRGPAAHPKMVAAGTGAHISSAADSKSNDETDEPSDDKEGEEENDRKDSQKN